MAAIRMRGITVSPVRMDENGLHVTLGVKPYVAPLMRLVGRGLVKLVERGMLGPHEALEVMKWATRRIMGL